MQGRTYTSAAVAGLLVAGIIGSPATAQEASTDFTSLEPIENIITNFGDGVPTDGLTIESDDPNATIRSQFQIMVNFSPNAEFAREEVALAPWGFVAGSTSEIESVGQYFDSPDEMIWLPPLHPWIDPYSRVAIAERLGGWTVYGEEGLIKGIEDAFEPIQSVWGIELAEPFDTTCSSTAYVGRAWEGASVTSGSDPLFTQASLRDRFQGTHQALAGTASRVVQLACFPGGIPTVSQYRNKEGSGIRLFGPTGTIAMVKGRYVVFFSAIRVHDGDLRQQFFATPAGGGPVEATIIEDEPRLLVPNPYARLGTKVTIVPIEVVAGEAAGDTATGLKLMETSQGGAAVRAQTGGGCTPRAAIVFMDAFTVAAFNSGFAQKPSIRTGSFDLYLSFEFPDGSIQRIQIRFGDLNTPEQWEVEMIDPSGDSCTTPVELVSDGETLAVPSAETTQESGAEEQFATPPDDASPPSQDATGSASDDGTGSGGIPVVPIALAGAVVAGGAYALTRAKSKTENTPPKDTPPTTPPSGASKGPQTFTPEDRAALQEVYKGADDAGLRIVGISEITRLEDVLAGSKDNPVVIGKATKVIVGVTQGGSLVAPDDASATSQLSIEVTPSVEFDSDGDAHVVWSAYTQDIDTASRTILDTSRSGPTSAEWDAKVNGRSDAEIGNDPTFKDWVVESMPDTPADAVSEALNNRG